MKLISFSPFISLVLTPLLVIAPLWAQAPAALPEASVNPSPGQALQLRLVESDGSQFAAGSEAVKGFTVEVRDSAGTPVPDAVIAFRLPDSGPTGTFSDGTHAAVAYTDALGRAHVSGIHWSATPGSIAMRVTANKATAHAGILIEQTLTNSLAAQPASSSPAVQQSPSPITATAEPVPPPAVQPATPIAAAKTTPAPQQPGTLATPSGIPAATPVQEPSVSVTNPGPQTASHSKAKWIAILAVIAGAGAGLAMAHGSKGGSSTSTASTVSVGSPTISVGSGH